jgi:serine protease Do
VWWVCERAVSLQPAHIDAWSGLAILAQQTQQPTLLSNAEQHIQQLDSQTWPDIQQRLQQLQ